MLWSRKPDTIADRSRVVGIDLTATRARAVVIGAGKVRPLLLDDPAEELLLFLACDRRLPEVGRVGYGLVRKMPHAVASNFLPLLAQPHEIRAGRHALSPDTILDLVFARLRNPIVAESDSVAVALPAYLAPNQAARVILSASRTKFPLKGTVAAPLAVAVHRAAGILAGKPPTASSSEGRVIPIRPVSAGPGAVVVVDVDESALSAAVVALEPEAARLTTSAHWPRLALRAWKDRLLDAISDRCVRLCRRDPRDSAEAEQSLFEQLDDALDRARAGQRISLTVRTAHWYQDVIQQPDELDAHCTGLAHAAVDAIGELLAGCGQPTPRAIWLTHAAGRLPGLGLMIHQNMAETTAVEVLPPGAVAHAAAAFVPRWQSGELSRTHLDTFIPLDPTTIAAARHVSGERRP